jgi:hypothetical protein
LLFRRVAAVRVFGNSHDFSHVEKRWRLRFGPVSQCNDIALPVAAGSLVPIK